MIKTPPSHCCPICAFMRSQQQGVPCKSCQKNPPLFRGGQGRSSESIEDTGKFLLGLANAAILSVIIVLLLALCTS